jgi:hypothetical protein
MTSRELAIKYAPHLYSDKNEPFDIIHIGYQIYQNSGRSASFNREIWVDKAKVSFVIEYQLYYDYDIQHMYDLEHLWVYVDHDGNVYDAEASAHGMHMNCYKYTMTLEDQTHIPIYVQPGKHAMFPEGKLFQLYSDYQIVCNKRAGIDGLLVADLFKGIIIKDSYIDYQVSSYIREHFAFEPSLEFNPVQYTEDIIVSWDELFLIIPKRIRKLLDDLGL